MRTRLDSYFRFVPIEDITNAAAKQVKLAVEAVLTLPESFTAEEKSQREAQIQNLNRATTAQANRTAKIYYSDIDKLVEQLAPNSRNYIEKSVNKTMYRKKIPSFMIQQFYMVLINHMLIEISSIAISHPSIFNAITQTVYASQDAAIKQLME